MRNKHRAYHPRGVLVEGFSVRKHPLYHTHANMLDRCLNPGSKVYANYGGRGIGVCERWLSFVNFVADMGQKPTPFHTLERKDNDCGYDSLNCVWATRTTQCVNRRVFETNTSGATGVKVVGNRFLAVFDFDGQRRTVGRFTTARDAQVARAAYVEGFLAGKGGLHGNE